ncbi:MAG TPA: molybdopterin cofactor-binding domain-containing protein, partial [Dehalococcoidia bacterium]|nr:molybdopterin cofactor-binding domain-containing protein [Dehalococcoidia bacterium]
VLARECRVVADSGAYNSTGPMTIYLTGSFLITVYKVPNVRYKAYCVYTNKPTRGPQRGHGQIQECFASDSQLDMIAADLGIDPVEIRIKNAVAAGDEYPNRMKIHTCELKKCLQQAAEDSGWAKPLAVPDRVARGRGIASSCYISGLYLGPTTASGAYVKFNEDGGATVVSGGIDIGQGFNTVMRQIAAEGLGLPVTRVSISSGDSDHPTDIGSYTSATTFNSGNAVKLAAADARRQLLELAAERLEASTKDLEVRDGRVCVRGSPEKGVAMDRLVMISFLKGRPIIGKGTYMPRVDPPKYGDRIEGQLTPAMSYAAQVAEVEVDRDTGEVRLLKVTEALDCGRAVNPLLVEGQVEGSVSMCQGQGLYEEVLVEDGQMLNPQMLSYKMPTALETAEIGTQEVHSDNPEGPYGAKEAGETSVVPTATAIANAIYDAVGVRIRELPITPERVLAALKAKEAGS